jgi:hypothetical protein
MLKHKYHITVSETPYRATTINKPGGTFVITSTPLKSRITNKISDEAGRWAGNVIILKNSQKVALISTYQTVKYQSPGTNLINTQRTAWLASNNRLIDPITGYQNDLILLLNDLKKEEILFILAGDFNEYDQGRGTIKKLLEYGLKIGNLQRYRVPEKRKTLDRSHLHLHRNGPTNKTCTFSRLSKYL